MRTPLAWLRPSICPARRAIGVVKETLPALAAFRGIGASDAVGEFEDSYNRNSDFFVAGFQRHGFHQLAGILALTFGGNCGRRVEH
jgi:hypothetical protein